MATSSPCTSPSYDPDGIAGTVPDGFVRWFRVPDDKQPLEGHIRQKDLEGPDPDAIRNHPEKWLGSLRAHLQMGLQVELFTLPPYLTAMWSIREGTNRDASLLIRGVLMEEMLHLTLVANVLNAVGGHPLLADASVVQTYPSRIPFSGLDLVVPLAPFSQQTLCGLRAVETPEELAPSNPGWSEDLGFTSIGEFYGVVIDMLWTLTLVLGPDAVFTGDPGRQLAPEHYYGGGGDIVTVPSCAHPADLGDFVPLYGHGQRQREVLAACPALRQALFAIHTIVAQGEGATSFIEDPSFFGHGPKALDTQTQTPVLRASASLEERPDCLPVADGDQVFGEAFEPAHFYKFDEVLQGRRYRPDDCGLHPTGETFPVDFGASWPMKPNPTEADVAQWPEIEALVLRFDRTFSDLLRRLQAVFDGEPDKMREAIGVMYDLTYQGRALMRIPIPGDGEGRTVGPPFRFHPA